MFSGSVLSGLEMKDLVNVIAETLLRYQNHTNSGSLYRVSIMGFTDQRITQFEEHEKIFVRFNQEVGFQDPTAAGLSSSFESSLANVNPQETEDQRQATAYYMFPDALEELRDFHATNPDRANATPIILVIGDGADMTDARDLADEQHLQTHWVAQLRSTGMASSPPTIHWVLLYENEPSGRDKDQWEHLEGILESELTETKVTMVDVSSGSSVATGLFQAVGKVIDPQFEVTRYDDDALVEVQVVGDSDSPLFYTREDLQIVLSALLIPMWRDVNPDGHLVMSEQEDGTLYELTIPRDMLAGSSGSSDANSLLIEFDVPKAVQLNVIYERCSALVGQPVTFQFLLDAGLNDPPELNPGPTEVCLSRSGSASDDDICEHVDFSNTNGYVWSHSFSEQGTYDARIQINTLNAQGTPVFSQELSFERVVEVGIAPQLGEVNIFQITGNREFREHESRIRVDREFALEVSLENASYYAGGAPNELTAFMVWEKDPDAPCTLEDEWDDDTVKIIRLYFDRFDPESDDIAEGIEGSESAIYRGTEYWQRRRRTHRFCIHLSGQTEPTENNPSGENFRTCSAFHVEDTRDGLALHRIPDAVCEEYGGFGNDYLTLETEPEGE
jgi:hypothetical protein